MFVPYLAVINYETNFYYSILLAVNMGIDINACMKVQAPPCIYLYNV